MPPGVWTGFGIDVGPAWAHVSRDLLASWDVDDAHVLGRALDNLQARVSDEPPLVERAVFGRSVATVIQAQGWGSALILVPDALGEYPGNRASHPADARPERPGRRRDELDIDLALAVWGAFADGSPDELDVEPMRWTGSTVAMLEDDPVGSPIVH